MSLLLLLGDTDSNPRTLFASGEQGGYYDPSVPNTLFQLSDAVTAATQPGDPVGLIIDSRNGGLSNLGPDLVTNGTFAADSDWTKGANWTIGSGVATKTGGAANNLTQTIASTAGAWYRLTIDVTRTAGTLTVSLGTSGTTYAISASGTYTFMILAGSSTQTLTLAGDSSFAGTVDNVVARNVPGNHLYQPVSGSRGTLSREPESLAGTTGGKRNLLTNTEQFDNNAAWVKYQSSISANATAAPDGTMTADSFVDSAVTQEHNCYQSSTTTTATFSVYAKANARTTVGLRAYSNVNEFYTAIFDLQNGTVTLDNETGTTFSSTVSAITSVGNGWYRCSISYVRTSGLTYHVIDLCNTTNPTLGTGGSQTYLGNGTGIYIWGAQLETGSTATAYQRNTTQYDCTESGKRDCWAIDFDGSDDSYLTSSVDFSGTDKMTVWAGVWQPTTPSAENCIVELSAVYVSNNGSFIINSNTAPNIGFAARGTSTAFYVPSVSFPSTNILSCGFNIAGATIASQIIPRINAQLSQSNSSGVTGSGNFGNYPLYIGRRNNTNLPFRGRIYGLIIRGAATTDAKVREFEKYVARITGKSI